MCCFCWLKVNHLEETAARTVSPGDREHLGPAKEGLAAWHGLPEPLYVLLMVVLQQFAASRTFFHKHPPYFLFSAYTMSQWREKRLACSDPGAPARTSNSKFWQNRGILSRTASRRARHCDVRAFALVSSLATTLGSLTLLRHPPWSWP